VTTRIQVNADSGKAVRVRGYNPQGAEAEQPSLDRTVEVGQSDNFYIHASMAIVIEEVQPDAEPAPEPEPVPEA
jgi:hypothetical protein